MKTLLALLLTTILALHFFKDPLPLYTNISIISTPSPHLPQLNQPFHYLGKGAQIIAFASEDDRYVLKLFKKSHKKKFKLSRLFKTKALKQNSKNKWDLKFENTCRCYQLALEHLQNETGLIHLHFEKTSTPMPVVLQGKTLDLSQLPFILQKKAILVPDYITKENQLQAKEALKELFCTRTEKGFTDPRQSLSINYGFIDGKAIQIDVGKIESLTHPAEEETVRLNNKVNLWFDLFTSSN